MMIFQIIDLAKKLGVANAPTQADCYELYVKRAIVDAMPADTDETQVSRLVKDFFIERIY